MPLCSKLRTMDSGGNWFSCLNISWLHYFILYWQMLSSVNNAECFNKVYFIVPFLFFIYIILECIVIQLVSRFLNLFPLRTLPIFKNYGGLQKNFGFYGSYTSMFTIWKIMHSLLLPLLTIVGWDFNTELFFNIGCKIILILRTMRGAWSSLAVWGPEEILI